MSWNFGKLVPLPQKFFHRFMKKWQICNEDLSKEITVELATTRGDLETVHRLLLENEFLRGDSFKPYFAGYQLIQTTSFIVAKKDEKIIAALMLAKDGILGLPSDQLYELGNFRQQHIRLAEVIGVALIPEKSSEALPYLLHMFKYTLMYIKNYAFADYVILPSFPHLNPYWEKIFIANKLQEKITSAETKPVTEGYYLNIKWVELLMHEGTKTLEHDLAYLFLNKSNPSFLFPERKFFKNFGSSVTPDYFRHLLHNQNDTIKYLSNEDFAKIHLYYMNSVFEPIIRSSQIFKVYHVPHRRRNQRFEVICKGLLIDSNNKLLHVELTDASEHGIGFIVTNSNKQPHLGQIFHGVFEVGPEKGSHINLSVARVTNEKRIGAIVLDHDDIWNDFIKYLNEDFNKLTPSNTLVKKTG
jgi:hypothetical protein